MCGWVLTPPCTATPMQVGLSNMLKHISLAKRVNHFLLSMSFLTMEELTPMLKWLKCLEVGMHSKLHKPEVALKPLPSYEELTALMEELIEDAHVSISM